MKSRSVSKAVCAILFAGVVGFYLLGGSSVHETVQPRAARASANFEAVTVRADSPPRARSAKHSGEPDALATPSEVDARSTALAKLADLEADFRSRFEADSEFAEYKACLARNSERCDAIFSDIVHSVFYSGFLVDLDENAIELPAVGTPEAALAAAELVRTVASTSDPVKRVTALVLLDRVDALFVRELPAAAYEGLSNLSLVEQKLLLARHAALPLPNAQVAEEVAALGRMTKDSRALSAALLALGHPGSDAAFAGLLSDVQVNGRMELPLARAVGRCATGCPRAIERMLAIDHPATRAALVKSVELCDETEADGLREMVSRLSGRELDLTAPLGGI